MNEIELRIDTISWEVVSLLEEHPEAEYDLGRAVMSAICEAVPEVRTRHRVRSIIRGICGAFAVIGFLWWAGNILNALL